MQIWEWWMKKSALGLLFCHVTLKLPVICVQMLNQPYHAYQLLRLLIYMLHAYDMQQCTIIFLHLPLFTNTQELMFMRIEKMCYLASCLCQTAWFECFIIFTGIYTRSVTSHFTHNSEKNIHWAVALWVEIPCL